jgi:N-acetylmuramoyl-L-alanine amidase
LQRLAEGVPVRQHPAMQTTRLIAPVLAAALALPATAAASVTHTVGHGETLTSVAAADGLSIGQLAAANGISPGAQLVAGAQLTIPAQDAPATGAPATGAPAAAVSAPSATPASPSAGGYVVRRGDTLSGIAARLGTTADALAAANGMSVHDILLAGRTLSVSGGAPQAAAPAPARTSAAGGAEPTAETVSPSDVGAIASESGVPASFAEAIADQESGFNNGLVSATGATGVMQIEPTTWRDLSRVYGLALSPSSAEDNIRGGVAILGSLLNQTGGDQAQAAAAYYQGLGSVRRRGPYASTRHYVRNVLALESRFGG